MGFEHDVQALAAQGVDAVCELVDVVIQEGLRRQASDIHIEPGDGRLLVRFRLDGVLHPAVPVQTDLAGNVTARVKVLADLLTYQTNVPQEGRIRRDKVGAPVDLRVSTFPTVLGEKVVIRLFDPATQNVRLTDLGYPPDARQRLERQLGVPGGVVLLTGPAGSGKTTTIYAAVAHVLESTHGQKNVVSVEDPVERVIEGVSQTQVHPTTGLTFARCLRSLMRQDPEVIVIGEIRDRETADIAVEAGLTGHLVISTVHSGTAAGVFTRLLDMGIEPHLITSAVSLVVAQRLVRRLCDACKRPAEDAEQRRKGAMEPVGCATCFGTGYSGRTVIVECLPMDEAVRRCVLDRSETAVIQRLAVEHGMAPISQAAADAVREGVTSPGEVRRVLGPE